MSLRQASDAASGPLVALDVRWPQLSRTARTIATRWADRPVRTPPTFQLDEFVHSVDLEWKRHKSLAGLSAREVRWLPHVIFHPEADAEVWLARDSKLMAAALEEMRKHARTVRSLLRNVIRLWPKELAAAPRIQRVLLEELRLATSSRLTEWHRRVKKYDLLSVDGPAKLARLLVADPARCGQVLEDAGLVGDLGQSAFLAEAHQSLLRQLYEDLAARRYQHLDASLTMLAPGCQLGFRSQVHGLADALLLPFLKENPPTDVLKTIRAFLLTHLKDPRLVQAGWTRVNASAKEVMLRWMVDASLEEFFALIARRAQEDHWQYRKAFWSAYLKNHHIGDACVVLGENAEREARSRWGDAVPAHGELSGGLADHCVLILRVGTVVITEWSHNGTCRLWLQGDKGCPRFHARRYSRSDLTAGARHEQKHYGNLYYTWQQQLAEVIRKETGISVTQTQYRVR